MPGNQPLSESDDNSDDETECEDQTEDKDFEMPVSYPTISQGQLDHFIRKLKLSENDAYQPGTMLREFGILAKGTKTTAYRHGNKTFVECFDAYDELGLVYCKDITSLMRTLGISSNVKTDWLLFIDGSVSSLKAVLLHVDNEYSGIPVGCSRKAKELYETIKMLPSRIRYDDFKWKDGSDLKIIGLLTGMQ